jgi:hypothetical protein
MRAAFQSAEVFRSADYSQFTGHTLEGKPPESFKDWRFLLVGIRWWWKRSGYDPGRPFHHAALTCAVVHCRLTFL